MSKGGWKVPDRSKEELFVEAFKDGSMERWARAGATDKQISENLGMSRETFYKYLRQYPDVLDALHRARKPVVIEAFSGLVRLALGHHEKTISKHKRIVTNKKGEKDTVEEIYEDDNYYPPNHQACTKVITNYLNAQRKHNNGVPEEYITAPIPIQQEQKQGRFPEMEEAMHELMFGSEAEDES